MKDRPILFSAPMVRAILGGRKTQTRRVVKQPVGWVNTDSGAQVAHIGRCVGLTSVLCPFGQPGDRLWVRECYSGPHEMTGHPPRDWLPTVPIWYWADGSPSHGDWGKPKPPMHMPRWASRLTLEITGVRVERLQDISEADAKAEGVNFGNVTDPATGEIDCDAAEAFEALWSSAYGADSWNANQWVWVVEFRRLP